MASLRYTDREFIAAWKEGGARLVMERFQCNERNAYAMRRRIEARIRRPLESPQAPRPERPAHPARAPLEVQSGVVIVASDFHYWPGEPSLMHRALVSFIKDMKPRAFIANGDVLDGARISRWPPIGWEKRPELIQELEVVHERLAELAAACPRGCRRIWPIGNHDARFETRLATVAPEYARINGVSLKDHFPEWEPCWSVWVNDDVVVKHRFKGGIHAPHNNTMWAGKTLVTGHLHSAKVVPFTDYNGTRWGVDTGTVADPDGAQFLDYSEDNPKNHRAGFCVLTFHKGKLLQPELVLKFDDRSVQFRGEVIRV